VGKVRDAFQPPLEQYLKTAYELEEEGIPVIRARLAERLGHSGPTVTMTVRRLAAEGYFVADQRELRLSDKGRALAEAVVRKHRLAERLLADVVGLPWPDVHEEADRWEHVISDQAERYIVALLGNPTTCAHGNPIPGSGARSGPPVKLLSHARPGERVRLERLTETVELDRGTLRYLDAHGFRPGASADVKDRSPDGAFTLSVGGSAMAVTPSLASQLYVSDLLEPGISPPTGGASEPQAQALSAMRPPTAGFVGASQPSPARRA
jgi:DtxR family Mn-dependent transcriptional regulator